MNGSETRSGFSVLMGAGSHDQAGHVWVRVDDGCVVVANDRRSA